ncbi:MAG TPA: lipoprotein [Stellaceae bacterium]|jgi:predicted small lipoprotein YifL
MSITWRIAAVTLVALALAGCGKKGPPGPPPGVPNIYPQVYPQQ